MIPETLKDRIIAAENEIKKLPIDCKMVEAENLHISLSFLGEVEDERIADIERELDDVCSRYAPFEVEVSGIKFIPDENYFRVLAIDCQDGTLKTVGRDVRIEIGGDVKPPHLTLCRVRNIKEKQIVVDRIKKIDSYIGKFTASGIQLMKSQLQKTGPIYTVLHESKLSLET